jgi:hypothetical protein
MGGFTSSRHQLKNAPKSKYKWDTCSLLHSGQLNVLGNSSPSTLVFDICSLPAASPPLCPLAKRPGPFAPAKLPPLLISLNSDRLSALHFFVNLAVFLDLAFGLG